MNSRLSTLFAIPALAMALSLAGCGNSTATTSTGPSSTADTAGTGGADSLTANDTATSADTLGADGTATASPLTVACPFGIELVQHPIQNPVDPTQSQGKFGGIVSVKRSGANLATAKVTLNDVPLTYTDNGDYVVPNTAEIAAAVAGATLKLKVTDGSDSVSFDFKCPAEVAITAPVENAEVTKGQSLAVQWSGVIDYQHPLLTPGLLLYRYDAPSGTFLGYSPMTMPKLNPTDTGATLVLPENDKPKYVVELRVPGTFVKTAKYDGIHCSLVRRVLLINKP